MGLCERVAPRIHLILYLTGFVLVGTKSCSFSMRLCAEVMCTSG